jgi:hypothetical protein
MRTDAEVDAFFSGLESRRAELARRYRAGWPFSRLAGGIGCLLPIVLLGLFAASHASWSAHPRRTAIVVAGCACTLAGAGIGFGLFRRAERVYAPIDAAVVADLMEPFAAFLVPEGRLEHPALETCVEWRPSLLFPPHAEPYENAVTRVTGRLAGLPAVLDEIKIRHPFDRDDGESMGWVVRVGLPFAVGGHLRVLVLQPGDERAMRRDSFLRLTDLETRLGGRYRVEGASPGITPEGADGPTPSGLPHEALLTDALAERLRANGRMQLAATGRTLWVTVPLLRVLDARTGIALFGGAGARRAVAAAGDVEAVVREVLAAGGVRS